MGILKRVIAKDASVVACAVDATDMISEMEQIHETSAVMTAALGRLSIAASMMGYGLKSESDSVTLRVKGGGPAGMLVAVADSHGNVKADVDQPIVELPLNAQGKLDVGGAVGTDGTLSVVKDLGLKEPYVGMVPLVSGEIAEDIAQYFATSEQTPTVCGLGVLVNPDLTVKVAGGFLIQVLPFASDACIDTIEQNLKTLPPVTVMMEQGMTTEQIALRLLDGLEPNLLDEAEVHYHCDCSRERTERVLTALGNEELTKLAAEGKSVDVNCHFCKKQYTFTPEELLALRS
ncbi:Hsp33 family molecular chaperone HslO [uncultured Ruminococcus sp.]|uniref:Hsp33 family molecular chaperone HslO n=1 Tax=uncultured Ruminococcus sp. TaxID=165186 RepID=UPI002603E6CB|nr:Hsp33 family molecular chaperone HslO [uncultured Ruminococcus sp.]